MGADNLINIKNMSFGYDKLSDMLINNLNLQIPSGVYLSIVGENGSCKTTFIKLILKLLTPVSGSIELDTNKISYVPQRIDGFNSQFPISVYEILKAHAKALHIDVNSSIHKVLDIVSMSEFKNSLIGKLSGGQQQRVFIARALMGDPELIILDEPSTGVDHRSQLEIYSLLQKINIEEKTTIISIEHNLEKALNYSTHILQIRDGNFSLQPCNEFKENIPNIGAEICLN